MDCGTCEWLLGEQGKQVAATDVAQKGVSGTPPMRYYEGHCELAKRLYIAIVYCYS